MSKKRMVAWLLAVCLLTSLLTACSVRHWEQTAEADGETSGMLFWEVSDADGNLLYLLGAIHVGEDSLYPLPKAVREAYAAADLLAVEVDLIAMEKNLALMAELSQMLMYTDGTTLADHLPADLYEETRMTMAELGYAAETIELLHPSVWTSVLDTAAAEACGLSGDDGVDRYLLEKAHADGKEIYELESAKQQYEMLVGLSDEISAMLLRSSLRDRETQTEALETMYEIYRSGDFAAFSAYISEDPVDLTAEEQLLYAEYVKALIDDRNVGMIAQALELLASGDVGLFVVGAAHMVGANGLIAALEAAGCTVEQK